MVNGLPGGTPPLPDEERARDQDARLTDVVTEALALLAPGALGITGAGAGAGDGAAADVINAIAESLLDLRAVTGGDQLGILDWLSTGLATAPPGDPGDITTAAMRIRDLLLDTAFVLEEEQPDDPSTPDPDAVADAAVTGTIQVEVSSP